MSTVRFVSSNASRWVRIGLALLLAAVATLATYAPQRAARAAPDPVDVTVTIIRFVELQNPDPAPGQGCCGDYYAKVRIGAFEFQSSGYIGDDSDISPYWTFTRTVDDAGGPILVVIQIWDDDDWPATPDDIMDLNPTDGVMELVLIFDPIAGTWTGDVPPNQGFSQGDGDTGHTGPFEGGERGRIWFDISLSSNGDIDGDGIPDGVERFGVRDANGNIVADMAALGADPCRKTIAVEIDFMAGAPDGHTHRPQGAAIQEAVDAFNAAPVAAVADCPYAGFPTQASGVNLVVDVDNQIAEQTAIDWADFQTIKANNFDAAREPYFHYSVWAHDHSYWIGSSGLCCPDGGKDFIVSLGSWGANQNGTVREQAGTFIHELGHSLGLGHGGGDAINYKPNYLSVMNYQWQTVGLFDTATGLAQIDYSRNALPTLDETALNEPAGIGNGTLLTRWWDLDFDSDAGTGNGPLDWTGDDFDGNGTDDDDMGVTVDINSDRVCVGPGTNGVLNSPLAGDDVIVGTRIDDGPDRTCDSTASGDDDQVRDVGHTQPNLLTGYDDWANIHYRAAMAPPASGVPVVREITYEEAQSIKTFWDEFLSPDLQVTKSVDLADAIPGDMLTYEVAVENVGTGPAMAIELVDILPDGTIETRALADLGPGESTIETFSYIVPFPIADGTVLENEASVTGENILGEPDQDPSNNTDSASTVVHRPDLQVTKSVDLVNAIPGDTLTYDVIVENVGTGQATAIELVDTLPDGTTVTRALADLAPGGSTVETFTYIVPFPIADLTVLTNVATVTGEDLNGNPDQDPSNNTDSASTLVHIPVLEFVKTATTSVNAGEAIAYTITYENTGSGDAVDVIVVDTLPVDVYYSLALDQGAGPAPDFVTYNVDGTTTLTWLIGGLPSGSGSQTIEYTARPSLLFLEGEMVLNDASLDFTDANGNDYPMLTAAAVTTIHSVPPTQDPRTLGFWRNHSDLWTVEILTRIQATDDYFDGADGSFPDGALSAAEVEVALSPGGGMPAVLEKQLLATYFNLATRRINAGTAIESRTAIRLGIELENVRDAVVYATETLSLPVEKANRDRYSNATRFLDEINSNRSEVY